MSSAEYPTIVECYLIREGFAVVFSCYKGKQHSGQLFNIQQRFTEHVLRFNGVSRACGNQSPR